MHLRIRSGLRRVWRGAGTLQIGLTSRHGTVLHGLTADDVPLLEQLREGVDPALVRSARGPLAERRRELVHLLSDAGSLVMIGPDRAGQQRLGPRGERLAPDAEVWSLVHPDVGDGWGLIAARARKRVVVTGAGRLGSTLATILATAGVGDIGVVDPRRVSPADLVPGGAAEPDLGRPREEAARDAVRRAGGRAARSGSVDGPGGGGDPGPRGRAGSPRRSGSGRGGPSGRPDAATRPGGSPGRADRPDMVVLVEHGAADAGAAGRLVSADVPHLSVVVREHEVLVGPLVRPGTGPCLRCLDLHRGDRDPDWPSVLGQLLTPGAGVSRAEETASAVLGAGLAALQVLAHLDGVTEPASAAATLEIELPDGLIARRSWPAHPRCGCHRLPPDVVASTDRDPDDASGRAGAHLPPPTRRMDA